MTKRQEMDLRFVKMLDEARGIAGIPFKVTSGYRSAEYQEDLRKRGYPTSRSKSPHEKGVACDIYVRNDKARATILSALQEVGFSRFGMASNFITLLIARIGVGVGEALKVGGEPGGLLGGIDVAGRGHAAPVERRHSIPHCLHVVWCVG